VTSTTLTTPSSVQETPLVGGGNLEGLGRLGCVQRAVDGEGEHALGVGLGLAD